MWTSTGSENCSSSKPYTNICKIFQNSKCREPFLPPFWDGHKGIIPNKNINFSADNNSIKWYWSIKPQTRLYCRICGIYLGIGNNNTEVRMHCHQNFKGKINKPIYVPDGIFSLTADIVVRFLMKLSQNEPKIPYAVNILNYNFRWNWPPLYFLDCDVTWS